MLVPSSLFVSSSSSLYLPPVCLCVLFASSSFPPHPLPHSPSSSSFASSFFPLRSSFAVPLRLFRSCKSILVSVLYPLLSGYPCIKLYYCTACPYTRITHTTFCNHESTAVGSEAPNPARCAVLQTSTPHLSTKIRLPPFS